MAVVGVVIFSVVDSSAVVVFSVVVTFSVVVAEVVLSLVVGVIGGEVIAVVLSVVGVSTGDS